MAKAQPKQAKQTNTTATELVNKEAAERAICAFLNISYPPPRYDWVKTKQKSVEEFYLSVAVPPKHTVVDVCVLWPEGQDGHGSVTVTVPPLEGDGVSIGGNEQKYVCWKNDKGEVEVTKWTGPPHELYEWLQYWRTHGIESPRNKRMILPIEFLCILIAWTLISIVAGMIIAVAMLVGIEILSGDRIERGTPIVYVFLTFGAVIGAVVAGYITRFLYRSNQIDCVHERWKEDSKKVEDAVKETRVRPSPPIESAGGKSIVN